MRTIFSFGRLQLLPLITGSGLIIQGLSVAIAAEPSSINRSALLITNVTQFQRAVAQAELTNFPVRLEGVVCWSDLTQGMIILQDDSGAALVETEPQKQLVQSGQEITLTGNYTGSRGRATLEIGGLKLIEDKVHGMNEQSEAVSLTAGMYPISVSWFDENNLESLDVFYEGHNLARRSIPDAILFHSPTNATNGATNWIQGLNYSIYENQKPGPHDLKNLIPVRTGIATNFDIGLKARERYVGLEFDGYLQIQQDGLYRFSIVSSSRNQLFIEQPDLKIIGISNMPAPHQIVPGQTLSEKEQSEWAVAEGKVTFVSGRQSDGVELELSSESGKIRVKIAGSSSDFTDFLSGSRARVTGIYRSSFRLDGQIVPGAMWVPDLPHVELLDLASELWISHPAIAISHLTASNFALQDSMVHVIGRVLSVSSNQWMIVGDGTGKITVETIRPPAIAGDYVEVLGKCSGTNSDLILTDSYYRKIERAKTDSNPLPVLTSAEQVKQLQREDALRGYPVKLRGVVTWSGGGGMVVQDSTMGVFIQATNPEDSGKQRLGEYVEIEGTTTNQFSPMILAHRIVHLGLGVLPEPVHPTWDQLMDGTLDTQFIEVQGVVTAIEGTKIILLTHDGKLEVNLPEKRFEELSPYMNALIRIRGCLWAVKDEVNHTLIPGEVQIHDASINVDEPAPRDLFAAPLKRVSELLLFDVKASAFQQVKVTGQIVHQEDGAYYLMDETNGLRFFTRTPVTLAIGDKVEVVGFPLLGGPSPVLREAMARRIGHSPLPASRLLTDDSFFNGNYDSTLVTVEAQLANVSDDQKNQILGLEAGTHMFVARLDRKLEIAESIPIGSRLKLTGVYVGQGGDRAAGRNVDSFEILLNSPRDIQVLARPPWWTIKRMLAMVGLLLAILSIALVWIGMLRRQVEQRTAQLKEEILVRQRAEQQRAVEEERSRIARDLHDDLGSSLTEISLLADAGGGWPPTLEKAGKRFQTIGPKARMVVNALDVIVWLVNPRKDVLPFLIGYIGSYAEEYLSATGITCRLKSPSAIPSVRLTAQVRHNLFLAVKEALHNIVRHARATEVVMEIIVDDSRLKITVADNGKGFDPANPAKGNGLLNLHERLANTGGECQIISSPDSGTTVTLTMPFSAKLKSS
ncbi:MAG TPA: sensor histidine kinase [Verrucomicrobiae bacterium]|nr:sensor histidine kinase [Verrucomicrobiae bacterium]